MKEGHNKMHSRVKKQGSYFSVFFTASVSIIFLVTAVFNAHSQTPPLTLEKMLSLTIEKQSDILLGKLSVDAAEGAKLSAASAFDTQVKASASVKESETPFSPYKASKYGISSEKSGQKELSLSASKTLRSGVTLSTELGSSFADDKSYGTPDENSRSLGLSLNIPLYDIKDGNAYGLREKAAEKDAKAALYSYYHQISSGVYGTMQVWWNYLAAYESMLIYSSAKESMYRYLLDYRKLVDGGERPQADINQLEAKYRYAVMEANAAESSFRTAGYNLCSAAGISCGEIINASPAVIWPAFENIMEKNTPPDKNGKTGRFDILSAETSLESKQLLIDALKREERAEIGLGFSLLHSENTGDGFSGGNSGSTVMTELNFSMPVENSGAKGSLLQQFAVYRQSRVRLDELRRGADIDTDNARSELSFAFESLKMAEETVRLYAKAYETEKRKQSLGMSTVLDVVNTADSHRDALLQKIEYTRQAASAAAKLAYVSGRIIKIENKTASVNTEFLP